MSRPLSLSLSCYFSDRVAGTLVLDPAEANPAGAPAGRFVRLYDTGSSGLRPWVELPWNGLQPVTCPRSVEAAMERYAAREQLAAEAQQRLARKNKRQLREARAAQSARAAEQRAAAWAAENAELHAAERAAEARRYAAAAREAARARIAADAERERARLAQVRHRDSTSGDALLEVFEIREKSLAPRTLVLFDPSGQPDDGVAFVFRPSGADPLFQLAGVSHPSGYPGSRGIFSESRRRKLISHYRAWQAGEREEQRRDLLRNAYRDALSGVRGAARARPDDAVALQSLPLMRKDISLALVWCRGEDRALHERLRERLGRCGWERSRFLQEVKQASPREWPAELTLFKKMLSARLAETAVKQFYEARDPALRASGRGLTDMSIRQLEGGPSFDPQYDLAYPDAKGDGGDPQGKPVPKRLDVKNSRLDPGDPNGYSRHYVKKLRVLCDGAPVRIVGAVSEVASLAGLLRRGEGDGLVRILGEVDRERMDQLEKGYRLSHLKLNLTEEGKEGQFYPPWLFEAAPFMVSAYFAALDVLRDACQHHPEPEAREVVPIPMALAAGIPIHAAQRERLTPAQVALVDALLQRGDLSRRTLPHIYLTLLRQFFVLLAGPPEKRIGYDPARFRELLFVEGEGGGPLGVPDPLESVSGLLESLSTLLRHGWEQLTQFTGFEFQKAGILYAFKEDCPGKRWTLMFTHCRQVKQCGGKRLVFGQEKLCPDCRHLICRNCSFCKAGCAGLEKRGVQGVVASPAQR